MNSLPKALSEYVGYVDPMTVITKECPICETTFESPRYYGKKFCSAYCRRKAKNFRETKRHRDLNESVINPKSPFFMTITNPSAEQVNKMASLIRAETTNEKPIQFIGLVPENCNPDGVIMQKQQKLNVTDPDIWVMFHPAMLE